MPTLPMRADTTSDDPSASGFWSSRFAQDILPIATSLALHIGLILVGLLTYSAVRAIFNPVSALPAVLPEATISDAAEPTAPDLGFHGDAERSMQNFDPTASPAATGHSATAALKLTMPAGGAGADSEVDASIAIGANGAFDKGKGGVSGSSIGPGTADGSAGLAPFGPAASVGIGTTVFRGSVARKIVYLCDSSGSMLNKFDTLRNELQKAVDQLKPIQEFGVIFFAADSFNAVDRQLLPALPENKRRTYDFLERVTPASTSDPIPGLRAAFAANPQLVYLLTDGDFPDNQAVINEIRKLQAGRAVKVKIHTIAFMDRGEEYEKLLKQVADENGGMFRFVAVTDLAK